MAEYISREAAVEKITFLCELREIVCNPDDEFLRGLKNALNAVKSNELIPSAEVQPVDRWISCKDEMPEDGISVLICSYRGTVSKATYDSDIGYFYIADSELHYNELDITHWQPLPKPPVND